MELEAHHTNKEKQLELALGSQAVPPQLRLVLNQFSLVSVLAGCDNCWIPGACGQQQGNRLVWP